MTAISLTAPQRLGAAQPQTRRGAAAVAPKPETTRRSRPAGPAASRATFAPSSRPVRLVGNARRVDRAEVRHVRLTRRGRLLITTMLFAVGVAITLFTGAVSLAGTDVQHAPVRYVTVAPGDTLWSIAGEAIPDVDRRDTVHRIVELNALSGPELTVGQRVAVPASR